MTTRSVCYVGRSAAVCRLCVRRGWRTTRLRRTSGDVYVLFELDVFVLSCLLIGGYLRESSSSSSVIGGWWWRVLLLFVCGWRNVS